MDICDGDLVRRARAGDAAAFRLLVERHSPSARARAARLCARADDVDDIVQEAFLQAFMALDRLRDPDRFGAWLAGIIRNVHRAAGRHEPLMLLAEWPEGLHPVSAQGLPSADDLDRAEALRAAVADLPDGQRRAVELYYYAGLRRDRQHLSEAITGTRDWARYQITGRIPADAEHIGFELALVGPGSVWLRNVELARTS